MKGKQIIQIVLLSAVVASLGALGYQQLASRPATRTPAPAAEARVRALYLHGNFRCETCNSIEAQAGRAIHQAFAAELRSGVLEFSALNIDKDSNAHLGDDFQLTSASLVLSDGKGPAGKWKVLERTWDLVQDSVAFRDYVVGETRAFLAGTR